jgi:putative hemolysin
LIEIVVAVVLILLNGVFALSELAIVSSRRVRLKAMVDQGRPGAPAALALAEEPGRFLSTVQIGITLIGILAGAFSGAGLAERLDSVFEGWGLPTRAAEPLAYVLVIGVITYFSVVIGELVPKNLALSNPERIACMLAPPMTVACRIATPAVSLLDASTRAVFRLFGYQTQPASAVSDEEIKTVVAEAESAGVIETGERRMIAGVLRLGDRDARGIMTPRTDVHWIDLEDDEAVIRQTLTDSAHSRLPVADGDPDNVLGVVQSRDLLAAMLAGKPLDIRAHLKPAPVVPDTIDALNVLTTLRDAEVPMALVHDEYGHFEGIVTLTDALEALVGTFRSDAGSGTSDPDAFRRPDGSWLLAGSMPADEMADQLAITLPDSRDYETVAGFVISQFGRIPATGESAIVDGWRFEIVDLDGRRVDKVLATRSE